jgi:hypothetical protein
VRFIVAFVMFPVLLCGQEIKREFKDKILFMNGREELSTVLDTNTSNVQYLMPEAKRDKEASIDKYRIFSITYADGKEVIFYRQDSTEGNELSVDEMRSYVYGERDALRNYKAPLAFWGGVVAGAAGGVGATAVGLGVLSPVIPGFYTIANGSRFVTVSKKNVSNADYLKDQNFLHGYERTARSIRVNNSLIGGAIGIVAGLTTSFFILKK